MTCIQSNHLFMVETNPTLYKKVRTFYEPNAIFVEINNHYTTLTKGYLQRAA